MMAISVARDLREIESYLKTRKEITHVTASVGGTPGRYNLVRSIANPSLSYGRVGPHELRFDRVLLEHQVVAFQVDVSIRITLCQVFLYLINILYQVVRRGEVYNQFAVRQ